MSHFKKLSSSYRVVVFFLIATQLLCEVKHSFGGDDGKDGDTGSDASNGMYRPWLSFYVISTMPLGGARLVDLK